jgi:hypothetical protein
MSAGNTSVRGRVVVLTGASAGGGRPRNGARTGATWRAHRAARA